ncbi:hypothetical protein C2G38_2256135 [Gigaspora rosea]|uniref:DNA 3'-5' helicase n=1 Tax=Gigaspora rosea TaxID=44941 RepID=A0A397TU38_9GLOM|nr:hypothetical protein C2G38_2256135 [Gigaspora rosea]
MNIQSDDISGNQNNDSGQTTAESNQQDTIETNRELNTPQADIAHRSTILRDNGTALVLYTSFSLQVLELHQKLVAFPARKWIPLLPGYTIYTKLNNHYFQLKINTNTHFLNSNLQIKNRVIIINGRKTLLSQYEQALIVKYNEKVEQIYNKNRVISRLEKKLAQLQTKLNSIDSSTNLAQFEDKNNDNTLELKVTQQMEQLQLGSMILVDTKEYNELPNLSYSSLVAAVGLMSGLNRHSLQSALGCLGITSQISKPTYYKYQMQLFLPLIQCAQLSVNNALIKACQFALFKPQIPGIEPILAIGFDVSWSHLRNAGQASGEFIYQEIIPGYTHKPILAFHVVQKSRQVFDSITSQSKTIFEVNFNKSSHSNKTLSHVPIINRIYADLKHASKNIRKALLNKQYIRFHKFEQHIMRWYNGCAYTAGLRIGDPNISSPLEKKLRAMQIDGLILHLRNDHSKCWNEICWTKNDPHIILQEPNLMNSSTNEINTFQQMLKNIYHLPIGQEIATTYRSSQNKAFNCCKLVYLDKKIDYWKSFEVWHALAILHYNEGYLSIMASIREYTCEKDFSENDFLNLTLIEYKRTNQQQLNISRICERNNKRANQFANIRKELIGFDFSQSGYGFCNLCYSYLLLGYNERLINQNSAALSITPLSLQSFEKQIVLIAKKVFGYTTLRNGQAKAIKHYLEDKKDTLVLMKTGGGKSLCFVISALLFDGLTIVISPLISLIQDQVIEMLKKGIPCAGIYTTSEQTKETEAKIFEEIVLGLIKILYVTPERVLTNVKFSIFLNQLYKTNKLQFVIDEFLNFSESWKNLGQLKRIYPEARILALTATITYQDIEELRINLNIPISNFEVVHEEPLIRSELIYSKNGKIKIIIATSVFGMVINVGCNRFHNTSYGKMIHYLINAIYDNCQRRISNNPQEIDASDEILELLEVVKVFTLRYSNVMPGEIVDVFSRSNNAEVKKRGFESLDFYSSNKPKPKKLKTKELAKSFSSIS